MDAAAIFGGAGRPDCAGCPLAHPQALRRAGLLWIGERFYATPDAFNREAGQMGVSRRIKAVPHGFELGTTWVLLAHRRAIAAGCTECRGTTMSGAEPCRTCDGTGSVWTAGIFHVFKPIAIEAVVHEETTAETAAALRERGLTPVCVRPEQTTFPETSDGHEHD